MQDNRKSTTSPNQSALKHPVSQQGYPLPYPSYFPPPQFMQPFPFPVHPGPNSNHYDEPNSGRRTQNPGQYGNGQVQYIPVYMPQPGFPYFPSYFPQPYNYMQNYSPMKDRSILNESDLGIPNEENRKTTKPVPYKTSDQIVAEFKSQTLPKLRLKRLVKLQAVIKGWHVRKFVMPRKKKMDRIYRELAEKKINEFLEDRIIPDIVLEIVTNNKYNKDYTLYSHELRNYLEITDNIINKFVRSISRDVVRETTNNLAFEFLRMKKGEIVEYDNDPFSNVAKSLITNFVKKNAEPMARECITEIVNEYLLETQLNNLMKAKYIPNQLKETVEDAVKEVAIEEALDELLGRMITELAPAMFQSQYDEVVQEVESAELERGLKNHIRRGILRALMDNLSSIIVMKAEKELIADEMMQGGQINYADEEDLAMKET